MICLSASITSRTSSMSLARANVLTAKTRASVLTAKTRANVLTAKLGLVCPVGGSGTGEGNFLLSSGQYLIEFNGRIFNVQIK